MRKRSLFINSCVVGGGAFSLLSSRLPLPREEKIIPELQLREIEKFASFVRGTAEQCAIKSWTNSETFVLGANIDLESSRIISRYFDNSKPRRSEV